MSPAQAAPPPVLYSFRRCPYAIRARMALCYAGVPVELREVLLRDKPRQLIEASAKATVPVLVLGDGRVLDESLDIMCWALTLSDPQHWLDDSTVAATLALIERNDFGFKPWLDKYKYADRHPENSVAYYREQCLACLQPLQETLAGQQFLVKNSMSLADVAIFPFIRQFNGVDPGLLGRAGLHAIASWLASMVDSALFAGVMQKYPLWAGAGSEPVYPW